MGYSDRVYTKAANELARRREASRQQLQQHRIEALGKLPELVQLQSEIADCGVEMLRAFGMGDGSRAFVEKYSARSLEAQKKRAEVLKAAGYPADFLEEKFVCRVCKDTGVNDGKTCSCYIKLLREIATEELSKSAPVGKSGFDNFDISYYPETKDAKTGIVPRKRMGEILNFCKNYSADFDVSSPSLFMHGETGLGKTHLSLAIASEVSAKGFGVIYGSAQNILSSLEREHFNRSNSDEKFNEAELLGCDLLVIDDLGAEFSTQFTVSCIYNIINTRISNSLPVIISTNLTAAELEEKYSRRITSRIIGNYTSLMFFGRDIRQLKKK